MLSNESQTLKNIAGTYAYMAPEMIRGLPYGPKVDVYSVGIILYQMLHGNLPFGKNEIKVKENL